MRPSLAIVGLLAGLALILPGCGGGKTATAERGTGPGASRATGAATAERECRAQLRGFLASMDTLRERLAAGLSYNGYLVEVRGTRAVYARIDAGELPIGCLATVGTPAERAFNRYIGAANTWGDCLATASCDTEAVEPKLQRRWALASELLSAAQRGLRAASRS